ncbi:helix-turn-helix domain-containing protein [Candidatus Enterococcus ferrettii]|uniref:AraC family transcriptional regulator n=1 Tax=Candidatus Enterococcus ferrettii TaxID=2815324 RepID=A0ABV0EM43_9ENTE|nr:helix-turn-helix domain-containing protein [Enterococcus sp. 665A]MBO1342947.1 AraC family transcriptional regulator [Enterococcus sp. 665A]
MTTDIQRFTATLAYIEDHLFGEISLKTLAKQALLSEYTFHRFFTYLTGYSFSNYVRNRRLSEAVGCLRQGELVDTIAEQCGYANRSAFHRAFVKFHGLTPAQAKEEFAAVNYFPPMRLTIQIDGGKTLNYRIEQLPAFQIVGKMTSYLLDEQLFQQTGQQWEQFFTDQSLRTFAETEATNKRFFGINRAPYFAVANPQIADSGMLNYFTGFVLTEGQTSKYPTFSIPKQSYVVFTSERYDYRITENVSSTYNQLQQQIFNTWLPQTHYQKIEGPELETYITLGEQACLEIWLPVHK